MRLILTLISSLCFLALFAGEDSSLVQVKVIEGKISPKSIVHSGNGIFFAQNMMYRHTITVYNRSFELLKTISDKVELKKFGYPQYKGSYRGSPVECAFEKDGRYAWVSNYNMSGGEEEEFVNPGCDNCCKRGRYDSSFVYKVNTSTLNIESVVKVGAVPKFLAVTQNNEYLLVSNWSSGDVSVVDINREKEIDRIRVGTFPRGIVVSPDNEKAYVAVMGSDKIAVIDLNDFSKTYLEDVGKSPRHLCVSPDGEHLYVSLNGEGQIAKIGLNNGSVKKLKTGRLPRSMELSRDGKFLYVVNYGSDELTKVSIENMEIVSRVGTNDKPIGVTVDEEFGNVWVACYEGSLMVFHDVSYDTLTSDTSLLTIAPSILIKKRDVSYKYNHHKRKNEARPIDITDNQSRDFKEEFYLVVGSFKEKRNSERKVEELRKQGYDAFMYYNSNKDFYYACVEDYSHKSEAVQQAERLKESGISCWIFSK